MSRKIMRLPLRFWKGGRRRGAVLIWTALMLNVFFGILGLLIDTGLLLVSRRNVQNAADAAAMAVAMDVFYGMPRSTAEGTAMRYVRGDLGISRPRVRINNPPLSGPYASVPDSSRYVEVIVESELDTVLVHMLPGVEPVSIVRARAVAGIESDRRTIGAMALDPRAIPGMSVQGGATVVSDAAMIVNSRGTGYDVYGETVDYGYGSSAVATSGSDVILASDFYVHGGVDSVEAIASYGDTGEHPLHARYPVAPDPLKDLPIPGADVAAGTYGIDLTERGKVKVTGGQTLTLFPGIYEDISITGGSVTFLPGVYILSPKLPEQGLKIANADYLMAEDVMFYATGSDYLSASGPGYYDALDGRVDLIPGTDVIAPPPAGEDMKNVYFASVDINITGTDARFTGPSNLYSPYEGISIFQRRRNPNVMKITGGGGPDIHMQGVYYAKWAPLEVSGGGRYEGAFIAAELKIAGTSSVEILGWDHAPRAVMRVFLVE